MATLPAESLTFKALQEFFKFKKISHNLTMAHIRSKNLTKRTVKTCQVVEDENKRRQLRVHGQLEG